VSDPREQAGCSTTTASLKRQALLGGPAAAFAIGHRTLRRTEDFLSDVGRGASRALGLGRWKPSHTTLYRLLAAHCPAGLEETLFTQVKDMVARKVVTHDRFPVGVVSMDGKGTWSRKEDPRGL